MAKLQSGTRIYGTANVDTSVYVGTSNNTTGTGGILANVTTLFIGNNTINAYMNSSSLSINAVTTANTTGVYTGTVNAASYTVGASFIANTTGAYHTGTINAASYTIGSSFIANSTQITIPNIPLSANGSVGTSGYILTSNGVTGAPYWSTLPSYAVNTSGNFTIGGNLNFNATNTYFTTNMYAKAQIVIDALGDLIFTNGSGIQANGVWGTAGQNLTSDGNGNVYWSTVSGGGGLAATNQIAWTNTQSFSNTITFNGAILSTNTISANGSVGTATHVLTSGGAGANVYWAAASGGGGGGIAATDQIAWTNTQSFSNTITFTGNVVANAVVYSNLVTTNSSGANTSYTYYNTSTSSVDLVFI